MTILHQMLPSSVRAGIRRLRNGPEFTGDHSSWSAASNAAEGFNVPQLVDKVRSAALKVRNGTAAFERDSVCFYQEEFAEWTGFEEADIDSEYRGRIYVFNALNRS